MKVFKIFLATIITTLFLAGSFNIPVLAAPDPGTGSSGDNTKSVFDPVCTDGPSTASPLCKEARTGSNTNPVVKALGTFIEILSIVVGIAAVITIMISGFMFITSSGDSSKIAKARTAIIYAAIGLVVAALAQVMVLFILDNA